MHVLYWKFIPYIINKKIKCPNVDLNILIFRYAIKSSSKIIFNNYKSFIFIDNFLEVI